MKETAILLGVEIVTIALSITAYKKNLRKEAKKNEIIIVAFVLSILLTVSLAMGIPFIGMPWAIPAYVTSVFFLQWLVSQKVLDILWKGVKALIKKKTQIDLD